MTPTPRTITIESREHLLSTLAEAAEQEHTFWRIRGCASTGLPSSALNGPRRRG